MNNLMNSDQRKNSLSIGSNDFLLRIRVKIYSYFVIVLIMKIKELNRKILHNASQVG